MSRNERERSECGENIRAKRGSPERPKGARLPSSEARIPAPQARIRRATEGSENTLERSEHTSAAGKNSPRPSQDGRDYPERSETTLSEARIPAPQAKTSRARRRARENPRPVERSESNSAAGTALRARRRARESGLVERSESNSAAGKDLSSVIPVSSSVTRRVQACRAQQGSVSLARQRKVPRRIPGIRVAVTGRPSGIFRRAPTSLSLVEQGETTRPRESEVACTGCCRFTTASLHDWVPVSPLCQRDPMVKRKARYAGKNPQGRF